MLSNSPFVSLTENIMQWSRTLIPTLREDPQEAEIESHKLMLRAGMIRKVSGGLYTFMPLGLRALRRVERIVREEMDNAGAIEVLMPALQPRELWEQSGRYQTMGDVMFRVTDRQERQMVLGPTHEEVITDLAAREINSYRQLPKTFYQMQTKFRDEIRPRFGLMRAKEFIMKDAYSFDSDWDAADASYQAMYDAYTRIFARCGLRVKIVEADTGAMGGKWSHEFMVLADSGEDGLAECTACAYAANLERAERKPPEAPVSENAAAAIEAVATPGARTIEQVAAFLKIPPERMIKTLIYLADSEPVAVMLAGDRELNEHKLSGLLGVKELALADDVTIEKVTGAPVGFAGPVGLSAIRLIADHGLKGIQGAVTGANKADTHIINVDLERDAGEIEYADIAIVRAGDACPRCGAPLDEKRGIEVGHVFKLGTKYSEAFQAQYLDAAGATKTMVMGCYGIGVTRTLQAVIEQSHDANGIIWPAGVTPYDVALLPLSPANVECRKVAEEIENELTARGYSVLVDDRDERPGVKFKDADLIGLPLRIVISERSLAKGQIEIKRRTEKDPVMVAVSDAGKEIIGLLAG
jgi:prolyl-tRNA synthetase